MILASPLDLEFVKEEFPPAVAILKQTISGCSAIRGRRSLYCTSAVQILVLCSVIDPPNINA